MVHDQATRSRARELFLAGRSIVAIAKRLTVGRATLQRWVREGAWEELRGRYRELEREAGVLAVELARKAAATGDAQTAYAATHAAELAGLRDRPEPNPEPRVVVEAVIRALMRDEELGPVVRRKRAWVLDQVKDELRQLETGR